MLCNYQGILNIGQAQLTTNIKAAPEPSEHGRFTYSPCTDKKMIAPLYLELRQEQRQSNVLGGEGDWPLLTAVKVEGRKKRGKKSRQGKKEIAAIRAVLCS